MVFKVGEVANPKGRPKNPQAELLREALIKDQELNDGEHFVAYCVKKGRKDVQMAIAILKKILPDLEHLDLGVDRDIHELISETIRRLETKTKSADTGTAESGSSSSVSG